MDIKENVIGAVVDECDRYTKVGFLPEVEASYLGLILHVMDLTSLYSVDNKKTINELVDKVIIYFFIIQKSIIIHFNFMIFKNK